ncbi:sugar/nucleoside kinase (ribokinase family) [Hasllibacter halocynthiae]|uniref:Sugar/nucleoside kinase (Ribokinase family) n=1 Tax=Hasllibacter halocynthiae TaxID=595589 RepID=A0A2T0X3M6_9RHOB|nr:adenosine kinase [Hasllibacter halocynthiae]PRY93556.1 sugar/nucleoside kinase (ribokinase family) [Hasllibacter halocynthiae]
MTPTEARPVIGIGNAVMDVISACDDAFLDHMSIEKGIMQLVERERAERLFAAMDGRTEAPGGSVGNTIAGLGALGLPTAFVGRVARDGVGTRYAASIETAGTAFPNPPAETALPSSRSMIFVTPDGERSMNTYLGASADLGPPDVDLALMGRASILLLEGYLFDKEPGKQAFRAAAKACAQGGGRAGVTLSDPFCVDRHRGDFRALIEGPMNFAIGNREEWLALYETDDLDEALALASAACAVVACTRSSDSVIVLAGGTRAEAPVERVVPVDATGAGDQFAAGFLYGMARGAGAEVMGRTGVACAAEVIGHVGPRPEMDMRARLAELGLA